MNREQYGTDSQLLGMLTARADRSYQLWHQQVKYFLQQWPVPWLGVHSAASPEGWLYFRRTTEDAPHVIWVSAVPLLAGLGGLGWQLRHDWRRCAAVGVMFLVMGLGLSLYLNMPDPQPRERHYVFGGMFLAWALWMGLGWTGAVEWLRRRASLAPAPAAAVACLGLALPAGSGIGLWDRMDRTGDYIPDDYAYNLLQSCEPDALLFTNGDNDTFPLWYLQEVEGIRKDVRVVNLSLLNTAWYIEQLRDREPRVPMGAVMSDTFIEQVLTDTEIVDLRKRLWPAPRRPYEYERLGLDVEVSTPPGHNLLRIQDMMAIGILAWNDWRRPVYFALTVAPGNRIGVDPYLAMEGMSLRLTPERADSGGVSAPTERLTGTARLAHNLRQVYRYRGVADDEVHKGETTRRLLQNYRACVLTLAQAYQSAGRYGELVDLVRWARETVPLGWESEYRISETFAQAGRPALAAECLEAASRDLAARRGVEPGATYENALALASLMLSRQGMADAARAAYRRAMAMAPGRYEAHQGLAAALQAVGRPAAALEVVQAYIGDHGASEAAQQDAQTLRRAVARRSVEGQDVAATADTEARP